jgi:hypothetical protein
MANVLDRVPVDRISAEATQVRFGPTMLTIIAGVLYGFGWLAGKTFSLLWLAVAWSAMAVKVGWMESRSSAGGADRSGLAA